MIRYDSRRAHSVGERMTTSYLNVSVTDPQVRRFRDVARASGRQAELRQGFERITVAAVGPIVAAELEELGVQVNVKPRGDTFFMKPLVRELAVALTKE